MVDAAGGTRVAGHIDLGPDHHTPWGVVHGGVYTTAVETAASLGASLAVRDRGQFAVGVHNATDFLRPATSGRAEVIAEPLQQGRVQQLWLVTITDERGRALARGQLRLQNVPLPSARHKLTSGLAGRQRTRLRRVLSAGACEHASGRSAPRPGSIFRRTIARAPPEQRPPTDPGHDASAAPARAQRSAGPRELRGHRGQGSPAWTRAPPPRKTSPGAAPSAHTAETMPGGGSPANKALPNARRQRSDRDLGHHAGSPTTQC